jgi:rhodanese-related sulfurtransferase
MNNFTHTVLGEYGTVTWCPHCPPASKALYDIYASGDYPFYYISFIMDKNPIAQQRMKRYFDWYIPMVYFDGGYTSEQRNQETAYRTAIQNSGEKEVHNLDIDVNVTWEGNAKIAVRVTIKNNGDSLYFGYLRAYVTEIVSRWNDQKGNPYHFGFLDYAFNRPIFIHPKGTFTASTIWDGSEQHGNQTYEDITKDNVMVIGAVSHWFPHIKKNPWDEPRPVRYLASYVDQTAAAVPDIGNDERIVSVKDHPNKPFNLAGRKNNADYARNLSATNLGEEAYSLFMERDNQNDDGFTNITVQEAWEMLQCPCDGVQIPIDVRTLKEFLDERIDTPYFYNRPRLFPLQLMYKEFLFHFFMWQHSSEEIILYCRSGKRSFAAAKILVENNFDGKIYNMVGGIEAWKEAGYPTVKGFMGLPMDESRESMVVGIKG